MGCKISYFLFNRVEIQGIININNTLTWHEKWVIFSLSGAMKREINQITKIREPIFQGQLKFILQTPYWKSSVVGQWPGSLTQARVMTDLGHDPIIFLGHDPILKNGSWPWPSSWPFYLKISALMAISWDPHSNLRKLIFKIEMMLKKEIDRRMTKSVDIWRNMNFYSIFLNK